MPRLLGENPVLKKILEYGACIRQYGCQKYGSNHHACPYQNGVTQRSLPLEGSVCQEYQNQQHDAYVCQPITLEYIRHFYYLTDNVVFIYFIR